MSSRAVPVAKMIEQVRNDPAMPIHWGANQPGMQANGEIEAPEHAEMLWRATARDAANRAEQMQVLGLHKQVVNRILEPYQWMHTIVTATEWDNFFLLRLDAAAEPNMRRLAEVMRDAIEDSKPVKRIFHAPYVSDDEMKQLNPEQVALVSAARCARVSYLNHDGTAPSIEKDLALADMLRTSRHASPFEHQAWALSEAYYHSRNFRGWEQFRERIVL